MKIKYFFSKVRDASFKDFLSVFPMLCALIALPFSKKKYANTWAICERKDEARDNGYHFFKYMTQNHPEQDCIYFIDKSCADYNRVKDLGKVEQFGGVKHWITYFSAKYLISSQSFAPNGYVCAFLEKAGLFSSNQVFLQHGITINKAEFLLASNRKAKFFITGAEPEDKFVKEHFGYTEESVLYTGFPRFDALHEFQTVPGRILIMPTWRKWLRLKSEQHDDTNNDLETSEYIKCWHNLINSKELIELIKKHNLEVFFYPHPNMKKLIDIGKLTNEYVKPAEGDLQELMKSSQMLITDYSSVFFDMVYMKKPVIFYQFDEEKFRKYHYAQGWFDYHNTAFGRSCSRAAEVVKELKRQIMSNFLTDETFLEEHKQAFSLYDTDNSKRVYEILYDKSHAV